MANLRLRYVDSDWSLSFMYPGLVMGAVGGVVWLFLAPDPRHLGLAAAVNGRNSPSRQTTRSDEEDEGDEDEESSVIVGDQLFTTARLARWLGNWLPRYG
uniref:SFRICE_026164 n=1 Tax=Spodoptera frugiperda TaxID=7108 RepID=A0A2H1WRR4_SPOFR